MAGICEVSQFIFAEGLSPLVDAAASVVGKARNSSKESTCSGTSTCAPGVEDHLPKPRAAKQLPCRGSIAVSEASTSASDSECSDAESEALSDSIAVTSLAPAVEEAVAAKALPQESGAKPAGLCRVRRCFDLASMDQAASAFAASQEKRSDMGGLRRILRCFDLVSLQQSTTAPEAGTIALTPKEVSVDRREIGAHSGGLRRVPRCFDLASMERLAGVAGAVAAAPADAKAGAGAGGLRRVQKFFDLASMDLAADSEFC